MTTPSLDTEEFCGLIWEPGEESRPTGLFNSRGGKGGPRKGVIPKNRRAANGHDFTTNKRLFAEALAEGAPSITAAARQIGLYDSNTPTRLFRALCADLGWQAV